MSRAVCEAFSDPEVAEVLVADRALEIGDVSAGEKLVPYASYSISSLKYQGRLTGSTVLGVASGQPGMTLTISQTKSVANTYSCSASVPVGIISASVGFNVTSSESIQISGSDTVPSKVGAREVSRMTLTAYPLYDYYTYDVYQNGTYFTSGRASHAVGVTFRRTYEYK